MDLSYHSDEDRHTTAATSTTATTTPTTGESVASGRSTAAPPVFAVTPPVGHKSPPYPSASASSSSSSSALPSIMPLALTPLPVAQEQKQQQQQQQQEPQPPLDNPPKLSFEDFALCYRQNLHKQAQRKRLEHRLHATKVSIAVSARLVRIGAVVQRGLVDCLKQDDKINFVSLYHTLNDLQESCESASRRPFLRQDPSLEDGLSDVDASVLDRSPDFFLQLSPQSQADLLDILHAVRSDPQFLFDRLRSLSTAQLAALVSSATVLEAGDPAFPSSSSTSRSRTSPFLSSSASAASASSAASFSKRIPTSAPPSQDHALAFERTDPLATLVFNVFAAPLDADTPEARLRLDVWSTVCANLITQGGSRYYPLIGHILSSWALCSDWKARPQFELYLMDILQTGAFLLEHIDAPLGMNFGAEPIDPLKTDVAEEFFASAVDSLFKLLDDPDAGLPRAVMEFGSAVLRKLGHMETRHRFLEFVFVHWFFSKFLYGALTYPEVCIALFFSDSFLYSSPFPFLCWTHKMEVTKYLFFSSACAIGSWSPA